MSRLGSESVLPSADATRNRREDACRTRPKSVDPDWTWPGRSLAAIKRLAEAPHREREHLCM